jgi:DNA-binding MarR family transcriptional regulator
MTKQQEKQLNDFFVHVFNKISIWENQALTRIGAKDLSVKELHVLEAVSEQTQAGQNTMTAIADSLAIRVSSLTTSVGTLVKKGYLSREHDPHDRRLIRIVLTEKGEEANRIHSEFHAQMIHSVGKRLSESELEVLTQSLKFLNHFFTDMIQMGGHSSNEND